MNTGPDRTGPDPGEAASPTPSWTGLAAQRWGGADATPGIEIPADRWDREVANWPADRWLEWHRLATELTPARADASTIRACHRLAYERIRERSASPGSAAVPDPPSHQI